MASKQKKKQQEGASSTDSLSETESPHEVKESESPSPSILASRFKKFRECCHVFVNNDKVQTALILLILLNAVMMGISTFDEIEKDKDLSRIFETTDQVFLIIFTVELVLQFIGRGVVGVLKDGWLCFDTVVIIASWSLDQLQVARAFRVFRTLRLATRLQSLKSLVQALMRVAPSVGAICSFLLLVMYIYGVMCTVLFSDLYKDGLTDDDYFGRLDFSIFTLFQFLTMENWAEVVRQVTAVYHWAWLLFISYVIISGFLLYSLIIAVICDAVAMDNANEDDVSDSAAMEMLQHYSQRIEQMHIDQQKITQFVRICSSRLETQKRAAEAADDRSVSSRSSVFSFFFGSKQEKQEVGARVHFKDVSETHSIPEESDVDASSPPPSQIGKLCGSVHSFRELCGAVVNDSRVQLFIIALIVVNAIMMGVATFAFVTERPAVERLFGKIDFAFLIIFSVELAFQLVYHGVWGVLTDGWLCFDLIVIVSSWALDKLQVVRALRVFRAARLINRLQTLKMLVQALIDVAPSVGGIVSLLGLVMFIYGVMSTVFFHDLYKDGYTDEDYFGTLFLSFFTLFQCVTLAFSDITRQVAQIHYWAKAYFVVFVILTSFILFSLVVAVVCDAVMTGERAESIGEKELLARVHQLNIDVHQLELKQEQSLKTAQDCLEAMGVAFDLKPRLSRSSSVASGCSSSGSVQQQEWIGNYVCADSSQSMDEEESVATNQTSISLTIKTRVKRETFAGKYLR